MNDIRELYQEVIMDHNNSPRNHYKLQDSNCCANGFNPLCGDKLTVYIKCENDIVQSISFLGEGCAISQASASMMTEVLTGKTRDEVQALFDRFHKMLTEDDAPIGADKLSVLAGVRTYPMRVKCATLAWHTAQAALNDSADLVKTE